MVDIVNISLFTDVVVVDGQKMVRCVYIWFYIANQFAKKYAKTHEWLEFYPEKKVARVGISDHAQG